MGLWNSSSSSGRRKGAYCQEIAERVLIKLSVCDLGQAPRIAVPFHDLEAREEDCFHDIVGYAHTRASRHSKAQALAHTTA